MHSDERLNATARQLLEAADEAYEPGDADRARVRARVAYCLGVSGAPPPPAPPPDPTPLAANVGSVGAGLGMGTKLLLGAALVGGLGFAAGHQLGQRRVEPAEAPRPAQVAKVPTHSAAPALARSARVSREEHDAPSLPAPTPRAPTALPAPAPVPDAQPDQHEAESNETSALYKETELLRRAQRALREGNGRLAWTLLEQLREEFPNGALVEERAAARVLTYCALGQTAEARAQAARFFERYPSSLHTARLKASCAAEPGNAASAAPVN